MIGITNFQTLLCEGLEMFPEQAEAILHQAKLQTAQLAEHF